MTGFTLQSLEFHQLGRREITARFDAPAIISGAGGLLLRELYAKFGIIKQFSECLEDHHSPLFTVHSLEEFLSRVGACEGRRWFTVVRNSGDQVNNQRANNAPNCHPHRSAT